MFRLKENMLNFLSNTDSASKGLELEVALIVFMVSVVVSVLFIAYLKRNDRALMDDHKSEKRVFRYVSNMSFLVVLYISFYEIVTLNTLTKGGFSWTILVGLFFCFSGFASKLLEGYEVGDDIVSDIPILFLCLFLAAVAIVFVISFAVSIAVASSALLNHDFNMLYPFEISILPSSMFLLIFLTSPYLK